MYLLASRSAPERYISPQAFKLVLDSLAPKYDYILIDCPAGVDEGFHRAVATSDEAIVVTTAHLPSLRDADKVVTILKSYELQNITFVVNSLRGDLLVTGECLSVAEIEGVLKIPLLGVLPEDRGLYLNQFSDNLRPFKILAQNLATGKRRIYDVTKKYVGALGGIRRFLKKGL